MSRNLLALVLFVAVGFVNADEPDKLVGANDARVGEFPYAVSLRMRGSHFCGGAIVGPYHILTAAHCLEAAMGVPLSAVTVVSGTNYLSRGGQAHRVAGLYPHPQYGGRGNSWVNDIGVIKLAAPINFNNVQQKINLPTAPVSPNVQAVVSAWGNTAAPPRGRLSENLQKLYLRVISNADCNNYHRGSIQNNMICTLNTVNVGTCSGDSGSPLVYGNQIVGVVSGGIPCARGVPDIFGNVFVTLPFIRQAMSY